MLLAKKEHLGQDVNVTIDVDNVIQSNSMWAFSFKPEVDLTEDLFKYYFYYIMSSASRYEGKWLLTDFIW